MPLMKACGEGRERKKVSERSEHKRRANCAGVHGENAKICFARPHLGIPILPLSQLFPLLALPDDADAPLGLLDDLCDHEQQRVGGQAAGEGLVHLLLGQELLEYQRHFCEDAVLVLLHQLLYVRGR